VKRTKPSWRENTCRVALVTFLFAIAASTANAESRRVQVGTLTCSLSASIGLLVGSQRNVSCLFRGTSGEPDEPYTGTMTRVGLDLGFTAGSVIIWTVFAKTDRYKGMLTGTYIGASAEMSLAAGLGANVLVGGSSQTVALQPLSVQGQIGLDIAAGVGSLDLHPSW
jgi:Protein of unknown function (DUF992)